MKKFLLPAFLAATNMLNAQVQIEPFAPTVPGTYIGNFNIPVLTDIVVAMPYTDEGAITTNDFVSDDGATIFGFDIGAVGVYCAAGVNAGETMTLVSPVMDFGANTLNPKVTFMWGQNRDFADGFDPTGYGIQYFEVLYKESVGGPWVVAATIATLDASDIWHTEVVDLSGASSYATFYIGFRVTCTAPGSLVSYGKTAWDEIVVTGEPNCAATTGNTSVATCDMYTVPSGDETYTSSGTVMDTLMNSTGCDSVITINLTINTSPVISLGSFSSDTICKPGGAVSLPTASPSGGTFSGTGVSGVNFDPALVSTGVNYVVYSITDGNGCSDIDSVSIFVENCLGITETENTLFAKIYPNPVQGTFTLDLSALKNPAKIEIRSGDGKIMLDQNNFMNTQHSFDTNAWSSGVYFVRVYAGSEIQNLKLIKQ